MDQALEIVNGKYKSCYAKYAFKGHGKYFCPECGEPVYKRSGELNTAHFAHEKSHACTGGFEGTFHEMSEWHKAWQERFPESCREIWEKDSKTGKCHRADVLIGNKVIEFQHSNISKAQFNERTSFWLNKGYEVIWLFDCRDDCFEYREMFDVGYYACYSQNSLFEELKKEDYCSGLSIFIEGHLPINLNHIIFEKGFNIYRLDSVVGTREGYASIKCNNNLNNFYNKTRFLLLCGVNRISKSYTIEEIVAHYPDSSKIAIYNYISGANQVISYKDKSFDNDNNWLPIYHSISEKQLKELEEYHRRNIEEHNRLLMERQTSSRSSILSKISEIEDLYKIRFEDGFAASNKQPLGLFKIKQEIYDELRKFDDTHAKMEFFTLINNYELKLDSYYLAKHRNLQEFIEIKEKEIVKYKNEMVEILNNLTINHL